MTSFIQLISAFFKGLRLVIGSACLLIIALFLLIVLMPYAPWAMPFRTYTIATGSMQPLVPIGSLVIINQQPFTPHIGQVIAFQSPLNSQDTIAHRIYAIHQEGIQTKGDFNESVDNWIVEPSMIKGQAFVAIPSIGQIASFLRTPLGTFLLLFIPTLLGLARSIQTIWQGIRELRTNQKQRPSRSFQSTLITIGIFTCVLYTQYNPAYAILQDKLSVKNVRITTLPKSICDKIIKMHQSGSSNKITVTTTSVGGITKVVINNQSGSSSSQVIQFFSQK